MENKMGEPYNLSSLEPRESFQDLTFPRSKYTCYHVDCGKDFKSPLDLIFSVPYFNLKYLLNL